MIGPNVSWRRLCEESAPFCAPTPSRLLLSPRLESVLLPVCQEAQHKTGRYCRCGCFGCIRRGLPSQADKYFLSPKKRPQPRALEHVRKVGHGMGTLNVIYILDENKNSVPDAENRTVSREMNGHKASTVPRTFPGMARRRSLIGNEGDRTAVRKYRPGRSEAPKPIMTNAIAEVGD